jgi:hypothetical protein
MSLKTAFTTLHDTFDKIEGSVSNMPHDIYVYALKGIRSEVQAVIDRIDELLAPPKPEAMDPYAGTGVKLGTGTGTYASRLGGQTTENTDEEDLSTQLQRNPLPPMTASCSLGPISGSNVGKLVEDPATEAQASGPVLSNYDPPKLS